MSIYFPPTTIRSCNDTAADTEKIWVDDINHLMAKRVARLLNRFSIKDGRQKYDLCVFRPFNPTAAGEIRYLSVNHTRFWPLGELYSDTFQFVSPTQINRTSPVHPDFRLWIFNILVLINLTTRLGPRTVMIKRFDL